MNKPSILHQNQFVRILYHTCSYYLFAYEYLKLDKRCICPLFLRIQSNYYHMAGNEQEWGYYNSLIYIGISCYLVF